MSNYKKLYEKYEQTDAHKVTGEVKEAEQVIERAIEDLKGIAPEDALFELDMLIGTLARAYEKQGFLFAQEVAKRCKKNGNK